MSCPHSEIGTICDLDPQEGFGLIESDNGDIVAFGRESFAPQLEAQALQVGQRVEFTIDKLDPVPHANRLQIKGFAKNHSRH